MADKFAPHDATVDASKPDDVSYTALSLACSLPVDAKPQAESGSPEHSVNQDTTRISAHSSSQAPSTIKAPRQNANDGPRPVTPTARAVMEAAREKKEVSKEVDDGDENDDKKMLGISHVKLRPGSTDVMGLKAFLEDNSTPFLPRRPDTSQTGVFSDKSDDPTRSSEEDPPKSSYSSRPSTSDLWRSFKPKVKLFPRPVANGGVYLNQRPSNDVRQKLPPGLRAKTRSSDQERPKSRKSEKSEKSQRQPMMATAYASPRSVTSRAESSTTKDRSAARTKELPKLPTPLQINLSMMTDASKSDSPNSPTPSALPAMSSRSPPKTPAAYSSGRPPTGLGINVAQSREMTTRNDNASLMSPEKQRLMKAFELRKRQQMKATQDSETRSIDNRAVTSKANDTPKSSYSSGKIDSAVGIDAMSRTESDSLGTPAQQAIVPSVITTPQIPTPRKPNPALHSHPILPNDACFLATSVERRTPPTLPPPPQDLAPMVSAGEDSRPLLSAKHSVVEVEDDQTSKSDMPARPEVQDSSVQVLTEEQVMADAIQVSADSTDVDEALIYELENAKLEEAKSLVMSANPNERQANIASPRSPTTASVISGQWPGRLASLPGNNTLNRQISPPSQAASDILPVARKVNVSSGISRRIQALAERSNDGRPSTSQGPTSPTSPTSFLTHAALSSISRSARTSVADSFETGRDSSPVKTSRRPFYRKASSESGRTEERSSGRKRDTVSITAHIQHDSHRYSGRSGTIEEEGSPNDDDDVTPRPNKRQVTSRHSTTRSERPPSTASITRPESRASTITNLTRSSLDKWRSIGGGKKSERTSKAGSSISNASLDPVDETAREDSRSRSNNILKRMSGFSAGGGRNSRNSARSSASQSSARDQRHTPSPSVAATNPTGNIIVGDLNVQFPDTLVRPHSSLPPSILSSLPTQH